MTDVYCVAPFVNLSTTNNGNIRPCCQASTLGQLNTTTHTLQEIWNSVEYNNLREKFLKNEWPDECVTCKKNEERNIPSRRLFENEKWKMYSALNFPTIPLESPWSIDLRFGNLCNLKCVMCTPSNSNTWYEDYSQIEHLQHFKKTSNIRWGNESSFLDNIDNWASDVKIFYFSGGEPMLLKKHSMLIDYLIENNLAQEVVLWYDTNGTYITEDWISKWSLFKEVNVSLSIDGSKNANEYIRFPISHDKILEVFNLLKLSADSIKVRLQTSIGVLNAFELSKIYQYTYEYNFEKNINISLITWPNFLSVNALPEHLIKECAEKYKSFPSNRIKNLFKTAKHDPNLLQETKKYLKKLDSIRDTDSVKVFPYIFEEVNE